MKKRMKLANVRDITGDSSMTINRRVAAGTFPEPHYGPNNVRYWFEKDVRAWCKANFRFAEEGENTCTIQANRPAVMPSLVD